MVYRPDAVVTIDEYVLGDEVVLFQDRGAFRAVLLLRNTSLFFEFSVCLSRACLGTMFVFI
jgi:hypothetical protein